MDCYKCQSLVGSLPEFKAELHAWLNQNVTIKQHKVATERKTGNSEYFQHGISSVLAKLHLQHYGFPNNRMN